MKRRNVATVFALLLVLMLVGVIAPSFMVLPLEDSA